MQGEQKKNTFLALKHSYVVFWGSKTYFKNATYLPVLLAKQFVFQRVYVDLSKELLQVSVN